MPNYQRQDGRQITAAAAEQAWQARRAERKARKHTSRKDGK